MFEILALVLAVLTAAAAYFVPIGLLLWAFLAVSVLALSPSSGEPLVKGKQKVE